MLSTYASQVTLASVIFVFLCLNVAVAIRRVGAPPRFSISPPE